MKKWIVVLLHAGYWLLYLTIVSTVVYAFLPDSSYKPLLIIDRYIFDMPMAVGMILPALMGFYLSYFILFKKYYEPKKMLRLFTLMFLGSLAGAGVTLFVIHSAFKPPRYMISWAHWMVMDVFIYATFLGLIQGMFGLMLKGFITGYSDMKEKSELNKRNYDMELALIKAQISPHFLFNTINNIDVLIQKEAGKASEYLNKLSDIMRFMLYETRMEKIPLEKELSYIEKYIGLQKIRTTNPDYVKYHVEGGAEGLLIEPMLFIPFIENAFKHSENKKIENAIKIGFAIEKDRIGFECENVYSAEVQLKPRHGGLGTELIQRRLALLYPGRHKFEATDQNGIYKVKLSLSVG